MFRVSWKNEKPYSIFEPVLAATSAIQLFQSLHIQSRDSSKVHVFSQLNGKASTPKIITKNKLNGIKIRKNQKYTSHKQQQSKPQESRPTHPLNKETRPSPQPHPASRPQSPIPQPTTTHKIPQTKPTPSTSQSNTPYPNKKGSQTTLLSSPGHSPLQSRAEEAGSALGNHDSVAIQEPDAEPVEHDRCGLLAGGWVVGLD